MKEIEVYVMGIIANNVKKGAGTVVVLEKEYSMNKGRGSNRNPFLGRVTQKSVYHGYGLGMDYKACIEAAAERANGGEKVEAKLKNNWHKPCSLYPEFFSTDKATESKIYLKLQRNEKREACGIDTYIFLDGVEVTDPTLKEEITAWKAGKKDKDKVSSTQKEIGLEKGVNSEEFNLLTLSNVTLITQAAFSFRPAEALATAEVAAVAAY